MAKRKVGKKVICEHVRENVTHVYAAYNGLSQVWAYIMLWESGKWILRRPGKQGRLW